MKKSQIALLAIFPVAAQVVSFAEIFTEKEAADKADDVIFFGLALMALVVLAVLRRRPPISVPLVLFTLALATKIAGIFIEHDDTEAVDPDYLVLLFMALGVVVNGLIIRRRKVLTRKDAGAR